MRQFHMAAAACAFTLCVNATMAQSSTSVSSTLPDAPKVSVHASTDDLSLRKLPVRFLHDEVAIVTSPARIRTHDLVWLVPLAGASAAAFATDSHTMRDVVSHDTGFNDAANTSSDVLLGSAIAVPAVLYVAGRVRGDEKSREAGMLAGEAVLDSYVLDEAVKYITLRERPAKDNANGSFFTGNATGDPSFVSGHCIVTWSSAAVLAAEYNKPWQQAGIYTLASGVSLTRVLAQQHFPSDALLGSAAGWLIGHYVYQKHHRDFTAKQASTGNGAAPRNDAALLFRP